jgi:uncharacterized protein YcnI
MKPLGLCRRRLAIGASSHVMNRTGIVLAGALGFLLAQPVFAHVTVWPQQSRAGTAERYTVRVPTERDVSTVSLELEVPAGVTVTGILAPAGFTYETKRDGNRIDAITWTQEVKPGEVGEFVFFARNPAASQIVWKAHQRYADGQVEDWTGPPGDRRPAPVVSLTGR